ncbi:MAG: hypothetical protein ACI861_001778 [Paracoccaceae bacterium]|jgi:hypothetical protein
MKKMVLVLGAVMILSATQSAMAEDCRKSYYHGKNSAFLTGRYLDVAKDNAIISWGLRVGTSLGPVYADWANAKNKGFRCVKQNGRHKCTASARPCTG